MLTNFEILRVENTWGDLSHVKSCNSVRSLCLDQPGDAVVLGKHAVDFWIVECWGQRGAVIARSEARIRPELVSQLVDSGLGSPRIRLGGHSGAIFDLRFDRAAPDPR